MPNTKEIKNRINTVRNIAKVTKTMQMISANRMKKAVRKSLESQPYSNELAEIMRRMGNLKLYENALLREPAEINNIAILVVGTTKGVVGNMISSLSLEISKYVKQIKKDNPKINILGVSINKLGQKIAKTAGLMESYYFPEVNISNELKSLVPIFKLLSEKFIAGDYDQVILAYVDYQGATKRIPTISQLLPVQINQTEQQYRGSEVFEPDAKTVLDFLIREYFEKQILNAVLSSSAAEHSARMLSMKTATDNAYGVMKNLTLNYNKGRQAQITSQIIEVAAY